MPWLQFHLLEPISGSGCSLLSIVCAAYLLVSSAFFPNMADCSISWKYRYTWSLGSRVRMAWAMLFSKLRYFHIMKVTRPEIVTDVAQLTVQCAQRWLCFLWIGFTVGARWESLVIWNVYSLMSDPSEREPTESLSALSSITSIKISRCLHDSHSNQAKGAKSFGQRGKCKMMWSW